MTKTQQFWHHAKSIVIEDWRGRLVAISALAAIFLTLIIAIFFPSALQVSGFFGAAFASWVSGLVLFLATGLVVAVAALARPDKELFEARARNLLQRQTGPHIDYIVGKLHALFEPYVEAATRTLTVTDYDPSTGFFLVVQETELDFKSYLVDVPVTFESRVGYANASAPPPGKDQKCCLVYLNVDGDEVGVEEEFKDNQVVRPFTMRVLPNSVCKVKHRMVYWVKADEEPNRQRIRRFTRKLVVRVHNQLPTRALKVAFSGESRPEVLIKAGSFEEVVNIIDSFPGQSDADFAYDFRLRAD